MAPASGAWRVSSVGGMAIFGGRRLDTLGRSCANGGPVDRGSIFERCRIPLILIMIVPLVRLRRIQPGSVREGIHGALAHHRARRRCPDPGCACGGRYFPHRPPRWCHRWLTGGALWVDSPVPGCFECRFGGGAPGRLSVLGATVLVGVSASRSAFRGTPRSAVCLISKQSWWPPAIFSSWISLCSRR